MSDKLKIVIEISKEAMEHALEEVDMYTDEGTDSLAFPASDKWSEFQSALRDGYDKAVSEGE